MASVEPLLNEDRRPAKSLRQRNLRVARSLDLAGKRVLDMGCGPGTYTLELAETAAEVIGIDHQETRIERAEALRRERGLTNVRFEVADIREPDFFERMGRFDLVTAWGFLHRIPDPFTLLYNLTRITDAISLEWTTPVFARMRQACLAVHPMQVQDIETVNLVPLGELTPEELCGKRVAGPSGYWCPTPYTVECLLRKFGYTDARVLGYDEELRPEWYVVARHLLRRGPTYARVHMVASRNAPIPVREPLPVSG